MKQTEILREVFNKARFGLKKHSPEIIIVAGVVGVVTSAVMACRATTKLSTIVDKAKEELDAVHDCMEDNSLAEEYTPEDGRRDLAVIYAQTGVKLVRLYAPSVLLGALSIAGIVASNNILRGRNIALAAAYVGLDKSFKDYKKRVLDRFGEEIERELRYSMQSKSFEETAEDGAVKTTDVNLVNIDTHSDYARFFDESCHGWEKDSDFNLMFLRTQQSHANNLLCTKGYLFLNEVYELLGIPPTKAGQIVGWIYDKNKPNGDNYVDFGIYDAHREACRSFVNGYERVILLDFNVDGDILDLMERRAKC